MKKYELITYEEYSGLDGDNQIRVQRHRETYKELASGGKWLISPDGSLTAIPLDAKLLTREDVEHWYRRHAGMDMCGAGPDDVEVKEYLDELFGE